MEFADYETLNLLLSKIEIFDFSKKDSSQKEALLISISQDRKNKNFLKKGYEEFSGRISEAELDRLNSLQRAIYEIALDILNKRSIYSYECRQIISSINQIKEIKKSFISDVIIFAAAESKLPFIKFLIKHGADVNLGFPSPPLFKALNCCPCKKENKAIYFPIAEFLIKNGADLSYHDERDNFSYLQMATIGESSELMKMLVERNVDIDEKNLINFSAFSYVKTAESARLLLSAGANLEVDHNLFFKMNGDALEEIVKFNSNPIQYILEHNDNREGQLRGLNNLLKHEHLLCLHEQVGNEITRIEQIIEVNEQDVKQNISAAKNGGCCLVSHVTMQYDNPILNNKRLLSEVEKLGGAEAIKSLIKLSEEEGIAEQILLLINEVGPERVAEIFSSNTKPTVQELITKSENDISKAIEKIEAIIGKEALNELVGWHQCLAKALSNNPIHAHASKVIQVISNLVNNLEEWLDFGSSYESVDINNQVTLILTQLNHWFDFAASGITYIGLPQPRFDPDYDPNDGSGGSESGQSLIYGNNDSEDVQVEYPLIFSGLYSNTTFQEF